MPLSRLRRWCAAAHCSGAAQATARTTDRCPAHGPGPCRWLRDLLHWWVKTRRSPATCLATMPLSRAHVHCYASNAVSSLQPQTSDSLLTSFFFSLFSLFFFFFFFILVRNADAASGQPSGQVLALRLEEDGRLGLRAEGNLDGGKVEKSRVLTLSQNGRVCPQYFFNFPQTDPCCYPLNRNYAMSVSIALVPPCLPSAIPVDLLVAGDSQQSEAYSQPHRHTATEMARTRTR